VRDPCPQFDAALEWYGKATALQPLYAEAHCNVGVILKVGWRVWVQVGAHALTRSCLSRAACWMA